MIRSPLNYTGGKHKLLPQILPLFPRNIDLFVDLFCGGCNVGLNVQSRRTVYNDADRDLMGLYNVFKTMDKVSVLKGVYEIIDAYGLSLVSRHGYGYYGCDSGRGLSSFNREGFLKLRADFNKRMEQKLLTFLEGIQTQNCAFTCGDFRAFDCRALTPRDFVYADPPYLITCATYNEKGGWDETAERDLLALLDWLHRRHVRFALSNVLRSKGRENDILLDWLGRNAGRYTAVPLNYSYANSNYQTKDKTSASEEVLIINY